MRTKKAFKDLILSDDFMFGEVMRDKGICRQFLTEVLKKDIVAIEFTAKEFAFNSGYDSHGVRLDIIARDSSGNIYDVEMQNPNKRDIERRARYYVGNIDTEYFPKGKKDYNDLKDCYIIFVCNYDHVGAGYARYEKTSCYNKDWNLPCIDGAHLIILNAEYENEKKNIELPIEEFLSIIKGAESNYSTTLARDVAERMIEIKMDHAKERSYMTMEELLQDERSEGFAEGIEQGLAQGRSEGLAEGIEKGLTQGMERGRSEGKSEGLAEGIEQGLAKALEVMGVSEDAFKQMLREKNIML